MQLRNNAQCNNLNKTATMQDATTPFFQTPESEDASKLLATVLEDPAALKALLKEYPLRKLKDLTTNTLLAQKEWPSFITHFISPLKDLGFRLKGLGSFWYSDSAGITNLIFERSSKEALSKDQQVLLHQICTQDDDGQPKATYSYTGDTLFLMIPTFG